MIYTHNRLPKIEKKFIDYTGTYSGEGEARDIKKGLLRMSKLGCKRSCAKRHKGMGMGSLDCCLPSLPVCARKT